jgi:hypothetical protein
MTAAKLVREPIFEADVSPELMPNARSETPNRRVRKPRLSHRDLRSRLRDPVPEGKAEQGLLHLRELVGKLKLTVSEQKTRI